MMADSTFRHLVRCYKLVTIMTPEGKTLVDVPAEIFAETAATPLGNFDVQLSGDDVILIPLGDGRSLGSIFGDEPRAPEGIKVRQDK